MSSSPHVTCDLQERLSAAKRRRSIADDDRSNLKNKFTQLRRRSEQVSPQTFRRILRSQSISGLDVSGIAADDGQPPSPATPTTPDAVGVSRMRPVSASYTTERQHDDDVFFTDAAPARTNGGESLADRMERRRQTRGNVASDANQAPVRGVNTGDANPIHERMQRRRRSRMNLDDDAGLESAADAGADKTSKRPQFMLRGRRNGDKPLANHDNLSNRVDHAHSPHTGEQYMSTDATKQTTQLTALRGRWERQSTAPSSSSLDGSTKTAGIGIDGGRRYSRYTSSGFPRKDDGLSTDQAALAGRDYRETLRKLRGGNIISQKR